MLSNCVNNKTGNTTSWMLVCYWLLLFKSRMLKKTTKKTTGCCRYLQIGPESHILQV